MDKVRNIREIAGKITGTLDFLDDRLNQICLSRGQKYPPSRVACMTRVIKVARVISCKDYPLSSESSCSFINNILNMQVKTEFGIERDTKNCLLLQRRELFVSNNYFVALEV